jgi:glycosyltransferase involved in cell wall biosynthesis
VAIAVQFVHTRYPHWGAHSGFHRLADHLDPAVCAVRVRAVPDSDDDFPARPAGIRRWLAERVRRRGMEWYKLSDLVAEAALAPRALARAVDVVHFLDGEHGAQYLPLMLGRWPFGRARVVATYHQPPEILPSVVRRDVVRRLDLVTVVSPSQAAFFAELLPPDRVQVVLHGIDTAFFRPAALPPADNRFRCITVGHWRRDWLAVRAVALELAGCSDVEFHVVTGQPTGLEAFSNVKVHRAVDDATLRALYQSAHVLFLPLLAATANNALLEGIACGLPVVSTSLEAVHAYLPGGEGILVKDNAPGDLAGAILQLRHDPALRARMARCARARATALAWPAVARRYHEVYERVTQE